MHVYLKEGYMMKVEVIEYDPIYCQLLVSDFTQIYLLKKQMESMGSEVLREFGTLGRRYFPKD